jgi:hypothetical protein
MIEREHFPAIAQSARAALQSLNEFIRVQQAGRTPLLSDELMSEFLVRRHALRQLMISAGCFDQHRVTVYPLEGPAHAALLILAAEVGADGDSLPPQMEAFAARLTEVVEVLEGLQPAPTSEPPTPEPNRPEWNRVTRVLCVGEAKVLYEREAPEQFALLDALQNAGWPTDGIPCPDKLRFNLKNTVDSLSKKLAATRLRVGRTENNTHINWRFTPV